MQDAIDMIRLCEDQFVCWNYLPNIYGVRTYFTPCVLEQYKYRTPIDHSASNMIEAWMHLYRHSGDKLHLMKAKALADNITIMQDISSGMLPTLWCVRGGTNWLNCSHRAIDILLQIDKLLAEEGIKQ
jgi:maltose/maltodextrin transport system substrate-binding protein